VPRLPAEACRSLTATSVEVSVLKRHHEAIFERRRYTSSLARRESDKTGDVNTAELPVLVHDPASDARACESKMQESDTRLYDGLHESTRGRDIGLSPALRRDSISALRN
jgi:hypothetical protein